MKFNILSKSLLAAALCGGCIVLCQCKDGSSSVTDSVEKEATETAKPEKEQLCGAYTEQGDLSEEDIVLFKKVMASAEVAVEYTPISVATQVVAGINYRYYCKYDDGSQEAPAYCHIVIYQPLNGEPELTEITPIQ